jgi:hypothetical protein
MKPHARRRRRRLSFTHIVLDRWTDAHGEIEYRMGRKHGKYYISKRHLHAPGLAGLTVYRNVSKQDALTFAPDHWIDP